MWSHLLIGGRFALGFFAGFLFFLATWFFVGGVSETLLSSEAFLATVFGALIAGAIAIFGQLLVLWKAADDRLQVSRAQTATHVVSLFQTSNHMLAQLRALKKHMEKAKQNSLERSFPLPVTLIPVTPKPRPLHFIDADKAELLLIGELELYNGTLVLDIQVNAVLEIYVELEPKRELFMELIDIKQVNGEQSVIVWNPKDDDEVKGRMITVEKNANELFGMICEEFVKVDSIVDGLSAAMTKYVDSRLSFERIREVPA